VDSALCAGCHRKIAEDYAQTGMGRSLRGVRTDMVLPEFDGKVFRHGASEQYFTPYQKDGKYFLRRHQAGPDGSAANVVDSEVHFVFGSGNHARSYLHRTPAGTLIELPLTWYSEKGGYWNMSPAYDRPDHPGFSREVTYRCLFCHNSYPEIEAGADFRDGASIFPGRLPEGIDCQRCHGPGRDHVNAVRQKSAPGRVRSSIVNPLRLTPERQMEICMQCHLETTSGQLPPALLRQGRGVFSYRAGEPLDNYMLHFDHARGAGHDDKFELVSSAYRLRQSRCFLSSGKSLTCTTCHNPHKALRGEEAVRRYSEVCSQCHAAAHRSTPVTGGCASCHMPKRRPSDTIHIVITDHLIAARPAFTEPVKEEHDGNTVPYTGEVALYYPAALTKTPENELDLAIAQVAQQSNLPAGLQRLRLAIEKHRPQRSEPYFELGEAYWRVGQMSQALPFYEQAAKLQPARGYHFSALGIALASAGKPVRSLEAMDRALKLAPGDTTTLYALGEIYTGLGRLREAETTFRKAIAVNPEMAAGPNNLGTTLLRLGDLPGAEAALREAVRLRPESAAAHTNLANVLSRKSSFAEAKYHFEEAVRIGPSMEPARSAFAGALAATGDARKAQERYETEVRRQRSDAHNNLGTALVALGDTGQALHHYRIAVAATPGSSTANFNLGLTLAEQGKLSEARQYLETTTKLAPDLYEAHLKLGELLLSQDQAAAAAPHLQKAAQSPDPQVRSAAAKLLKP
jgi:predicted CXXCH cytochrome family protein